LRKHSVIGIHHGPLARIPPVTGGQTAAKTPAAVMRVPSRTAIKAPRHTGMAQLKKY